MTINEDHISQINEGRTASVCLQWMEPIFQSIEKSLTDSLKAQFRQGKHTELVLACHVAQLCAVDDLRSRIKGIAVRGDTAAIALSEETDEGNYE